MDKYTKFDLHIHSAASAKTKTGDKIIAADSTKENLPILIDKLKEENINMVSITDHNIFDKDIYLELKKQEAENNCISKVLPGVEIDLDIDGKIVHVVCIFDDSKVNYVEKIDEGFTSQKSYTVDDVGALLRKINLSVILIAHQKCDYLSEKPSKTSLSCAGKEAFYKFIGCEFFDALEIQNTKVEGILKSRFEKDNISNVNLVVGSDCHEWSAYPSHHQGRPRTELMFIKALSTFEGLVMAATDESRICRFVNPEKENTLKEIILDIDGMEKKIELSDNINVIIGDNSVGKSSLVKYLSGKAEKGMMEFLENHGIEIKTPVLQNQVFTYSGQGKIREMFECNEEKLPIREKFKDMFIPIDINKYQEIIKKILLFYREIWERNEKIKNNKLSIEKNLYIPIFTEKDKHYLTIDLNLKKVENEYIKLMSVFDELYNKFKDFNNCLSLFDQADLNKLVEVRKEILEIGKKYNRISGEINFQNEINGVFTYAAKVYNDNILKLSNSDENTLTSFRTEYIKGIQAVCKAIEYKYTDYYDVWKDFKPFRVEETINQFEKYCFICKGINEKIITKEEIVGHISKFINSEKALEEMTTTEVLNEIKGKRNIDQSLQNIGGLLNLIYKSFCEDYLKTTVEIKRGNDKLSESNSAGINALYYIDILSETYSKPIFIIDQPEDDVSQSRIATNLIDSLKRFSKKAQIILVTHNPQLVVNLDADNVIVIKKDIELQKIKFYSGPLEFQNEEYTILDLVAHTLDGGADVIKKRWKRYDKTNI